MFIVNFYKTESLLFIISIFLPSFSINKYFRPVLIHASAVVPLPPKGSNTTCPSLLEANIKSVTIERGFWSGCPTLSFERCPNSAGRSITSLGRAPLDVS
jgi:hypothetical protein